MPDEQTHPNRIRELALEKGLLLGKVARALGVAELTMYDLGSGKRLPTFETCRKLELFFGMPITDIYPNSYDGIKIHWDLIKEDR